ncbi:Vps53-like protein, partial [Globomyces pollinis-pini]
MAQKLAKVITNSKDNDYDVLSASLQSSNLPKLPSPTTRFEEASHEIIEISSDIDMKIRKVLNQEQDLTTFNVIKYVNEIFPDEESISKVDSILLKLKNQIFLLDSQLKSLVQEKQTTINQQLVTQIQTDMKNLVAKIADIKSKASDCESTVLEITTDIKSLDQTKTNLSMTIGLLNRIHVTVHGIEYVKGLANRKQYEQMADVLRYLVPSIAPLKEYPNVQQIVSLCDRFNGFQNEVKKSIFSEFESAFHGGTYSKQVELLHSSCIVLELLDSNWKEQLIKWYCDLQLADYYNIFRKNPEVAGLQDVSRRYSWLKRLLKNYDEQHANLFPESWEMGQRFTLQFCRETNHDLSEVMTKSEMENSFDTKSMLQAIQTTLDFESKVMFRFNINPTAEATSPSKAVDVNSSFYRVITSCFDPFLWHYVDMEDQVLKSKFEGYNKSLGEIEDGIFSSSVELFLFYRQTFANCAKLSTGKPFLDLCKMYQKWLDIYKDVLLGKLFKDERRPLSPEDITLVCGIINTSDYCNGTSEQLENKLGETIDEKMKTLVSFSAEMEGFLTTTATAIQSLVKGIENTLEPAFNLMSKKSWSSLATVGDQSEHITMIAGILQTNIPLVRKQIASQKFFRTFCDKFVESFLTKFLNNIYNRCKPMSEVGAEQMLLDTHSLNNILVAMTMLGVEEKTQPPPSFMKILARCVS